MHCWFVWVKAYCFVNLISQWRASKIMYRSGIFVLISFCLLKVTSLAQPAWLGNSLYSHFKFPQSYYANKKGNLTTETDRFGEADKALRLDGGIFETNNARFFGRVGKYTVSFWMKRDAGSGYAYLITKAAWASNQFGIIDNIAGKGRLYLFSSPMESGGVFTPSLPSEKWVHVCVVWEESYVAVYFDGQMVVENENFRYPTSFSVETIHIGATLKNSSQFIHSFKGSIDDLRIYRSALSPTHISQLFMYEEATPRRRDRLSFSDIPATGTAKMINGFVTNVELDHSGSGYVSAPTVILSGGNPIESATAEALVEDGRLISISITNAGSGYKNAPKLVITSPPSDVKLQISVSKIESILPETERTRTAVAHAQISNGFIIGAEIVDGGSGYNKAPNLTIVDDSGVGALGIASIKNGRVVSITLTKAGFGYSEQTRLRLASPPPNPDAIPKVTEIEVSLAVELPNNYYVLQSSEDMNIWNNIGTEFFVDEESFTRTVKVDKASEFYRVIQIH